MLYSKQQQQQQQSEIRFSKEHSDHPLLRTIKGRSSDTSNNNSPIIRYFKQQHSGHPILQITATTKVRYSDTPDNSPIIRYSEQQRADHPVLQTTTVRYSDTANNNNCPIFRYSKQQRKQQQQSDHPINQTKTVRYSDTPVVYVGMGLDLHQILYRQILRVKNRTPFRRVVMLPPIRLLSDKKDSKTI